MFGLDPAGELTLGGFVVAVLFGVIGLFSARKSDKGSDVVDVDEKRFSDQLDAMSENSDRQHEQITELMAENRRLWRENTHLRQSAAEHRHDRPRRGNPPNTQEC